jgi:tetratricopeptide (TPR) repeat protein
VRISAPSQGRKRVASDLLERTQPAIRTDSRLAAHLAAMRSLRCALVGEAAEAVRYGLAARDIGERALPGDEWIAAMPLILLRAYTWLGDFEAADREVETALAAPSLAEPARLVDLRGAKAYAWFEAGHLTKAAQAARDAAADAKRLGFDQHFFAGDYLRVLAGVALERRDLDEAEHLTERALAVSEHGRPAFEFLALLNRAAIWAARGQFHKALASVETARLVLAGTSSGLLVRPTSSRQCCACHSATRAPLSSSPVGCPLPPAACCWPGSRSPRTITRPLWCTWTPGRWGT